MATVKVLALVVQLPPQSMLPLELEEELELEDKPLPELDEALLEPEALLDSELVELLPELVELEVDEELPALEEELLELEEELLPELMLVPPVEAEEELPEGSGNGGLLTPHRDRSAAPVRLRLPRSRWRRDSSASSRSFRRWTSALPTGASQLTTGALGVLPAPNHERPESLVTRVPAPVLGSMLITSPAESKP
jgi:hypothetical protein